MLTFGLLSDPHYAPGAHNTRFYGDSLAKAECCVETFNLRALPLAVAMGDLIDHAPTVEDEIDCLDELCRAFAAFRGQRLVVVGNHDLASLTKGAFAEHVHSECAPIAGWGLYGSLDLCGVHLVYLDGNYRPDGAGFGCGNFCWDDAWLSEEQVSWLGADLQAAAGRPAIVLCHEHLAPTPELAEGERDPHVVGNAAQARAAIERAGNVRAVIQGHYHRGRTVVVNGIPYVGLAAMVEGPGLENNTYAIASLYADGGLSIEGFGRQPSLLFPEPST